MSATHTYSVLGVSKRTYNEIRAKLKAAHYEHAFQRTTSFTQSGTGLDVAEEEVIDMHGIALGVEPPRRPKAKVSR